MSSIETGLRLTCIAALFPEKLSDIEGRKEKGLATEELGEDTKAVKEVQPTRRKKSRKRQRKTREGAEGVTEEGELDNSVTMKCRKNSDTAESTKAITESAKTVAVPEQSKTETIQVDSSQTEKPRKRKKRMAEVKVAKKRKRMNKQALEGEH